ncbi:MAG: transglycosylase domain-containing protein [Clostridia bacterium]|nr:transglycosylase domain-containing protein [Clostridia bacterium]
MTKHNEKKRRPAIKIVFGVLLLTVAAVLLAASALFRFDEWHELDPERITECPRILIICDGSGEPAALMGPEKRIWISIDGLQRHTVDAFVAAEDVRYYTHGGIDLYRIFGAAWADLKAGGYVQGASTISQQLIKLSHLSTEKTLDRKLEEAVLATRLEKLYGKDEIMEMYLNYIYFGGGFYGIEAAALGYFGVHAGELTAAQSAQLAGILKSPSAYAPHLDLEASLSRRNNVLRLMFENGFLQEDEYEAARNEDCVLNNSLPKKRNLLIDRAVNEAQGILGITREELLKGGYTIITTMDSEIQTQCEELFCDGRLFPTASAQSALVVLDSTGGVTAMIGGRGDYDPSGIDRAAGIERQPGSLIKPILVYAPALELFGYSAATVLDDEPTSFGDYSPRNSDDKYYGAVTLRTAVSKSLNIPAVKVLADIGLPSAVAFAQSAGIDFTGEDLGLPLALGGFTHGVSPLEMAAAYSALRDGVYIKPTTIERILGPDGSVVYSRRPNGRRIMSRGSAYILTSMLQSAAKDGTARRLNETGLPIAAKTGTSVDDNGVRDAWCAAYTSEITAVIWMGTDSASEGSLPDDAVGGNQPAVLLGKLFSAIYKSRTCGDFVMTDDIEEIALDLSELESGRVYAASGSTPAEYSAADYFKKGAVPFEINPVWAVPEAPQEIGWSMNGGLPVISFTAENEEIQYEILRSGSNGGWEKICSFSGRSGYLSFTDTDVTPGASYSYEIVAENPRLGGKGRSDPSRVLRVIVPYYPQ